MSCVVAELWMRQGGSMKVFVWQGSTIVQLMADSCKPTPGTVPIPFAKYISTFHKHSWLALWECCYNCAFAT